MAAKKVSIKGPTPTEGATEQGEVEGPPRPTFEQMWFNDPVEGREAQKLALKLRENVVLRAETMRIYLERTGIIPMLLQGLQHMAKARPSDPAEWLAAFLLKNNPRKDMIIKPPKIKDPYNPLSKVSKGKEIAEVPPAKK